MRRARAIWFVVLLAALTACGKGSRSLTTSAESPSPSAVVSPTPTPTATRMDWATYSVSASKDSDDFSFGYPASWHIQASKVDDRFQGLTIILYSWDPATWSHSNLFPPGSVKVDVIAQLSPFSCGPSGTGVTIDGLPAHQSTMNFVSPKDGITRAHEFQLERGQFTYCFVAYFAQPEPDESDFSRIVSSVDFT